MATTLLERPMSDEKPKTLSVKLHMDVIESARIIAALRGVSMTDLISDMIREPLAAIEREELDRRSAATRPSRSSKRSGLKVGE